MTVFNIFGIFLGAGGNQEGFDVLCAPPESEAKMNITKGGSSVVFSKLNSSCMELSKKIAGEYNHAETCACSVVVSFNMHIGAGVNFDSSYFTVNLHVISAPRIHLL